MAMYQRPEESELPQVQDAKEITTEVASGLVGVIKHRFKMAEDGRNSDEVRWLNSHRNYRGSIESSTDSKTRSRVFVKITKVKVLASYGQIMDILFSQGKFPITVRPTPRPEGVAEFAHLKQNQAPTPEPDPYGNPDDGGSLLPGALKVTESSNPPHWLGGAAQDFKDANLVPGPGKMGEPQIEPAKLAAAKMEKTIHDQLESSNGVRALSRAIFEQCLLGTGILKGPFNSYKTIHRWAKNEEGERFYDPYTKLIPALEQVSLWNFYPDPAAINDEQMEWAIQRHKLNATQMRDLMKYPFFREDQIKEAISIGPRYEKRGFEDTLYHLEETTIHNDFERYEVLEYWGTMDAQLLRESGMEIEGINDEMDEVQVNVWICGTNILRAVINPFTPARIPYLAIPYEINPYQFFGIGVAENMDDAQRIMNGHVRMAIDNLALAGNMVFDIDETALVAGQTMDIYAGKIFRRKSGQAGTAVTGIKFPNTAPENIQMYDKARQLADEETGIPSVTHGQTGVTGTGRTAAGLSMLMGAAGVSQKTVIKNIDEYGLRPLGESYFQWNMQFNEDDMDITGDLEIVASGTSGMMQKEVQSQRLGSLLQVITNPMLTPFFKVPNIAKEYAMSLDIDPESMVNDMAEAQIMADVLRGLNVQQGEGEGNAPSMQPGGGGGVGGVPAGANPADASGVGGGTVGVGDSPQAGQAGFTGNGGGIA